MMKVLTETQANTIDGFSIGKWSDELEKSDHFIDFGLFLNKTMLLFACL